MNDESYQNTVAFILLGILMLSPSSFAASDEMSKRRGDEIPSVLPEFHYGMNKENVEKMNNLDELIGKNGHFEPREKKVSFQKPADPPTE